MERYPLRPFLVTMEGVRLRDADDDRKELRKGAERDDEGFSRRFGKRVLNRKFRQKCSKFSYSMYQYK